jgi:hypothetical protein
MTGKNFHSVVNRQGIVGIRCNHRQGTTILCYTSPYATAKRNDWLIRNLIRLYSAYYRKVRWESAGRFWKKKEPAIAVSYASFYGGEMFNGDQDEKSETR